MLRDHSGGDGLFRGGDGVVREMEFRRDLNLSLLSERRNEEYKPYGLFGGADGTNGKNLIYRQKQNTWEDVGGKSLLAMGAGDRLRVLTPGGGGFGAGAKPNLFGKL